MELSTEERIEIETKREIKETIYESDKIKYEEIINRIMNKSHLVFIISVGDKMINGKDKECIIYVEEKINCYDSYITHLNTNSFFIVNSFMNDEKYKSEGVLIGSKENDILFSFKYSHERKEKRQEETDNSKCEIKMNEKEGIVMAEYVWNREKTTIDMYLIKHVKIIEMKRTGEETEKENKKEVEDNETTNKIDRYSMFVISKYFNTVNDYIKLEKSCKEYSGIIEQFKYNPIPFKNQKERELFKNIETYHFYHKEEETENNDSRIKQFVHWKVSYSKWKEKEKDNKVYKEIEYNEEDMKKYLLDHEEYWWKKLYYLRTENVEISEEVTCIGNWCFSNCYNLTQMIIPVSVKSIGNHCFHHCDNLKKIVIPTGVISIGNYCFSFCSSLSAINIPTSVSSIRDACFYECSNLKTINIPTSISSIGDNCFYNCSHLSKITIPSSVSSIGNSCFSLCVNLSDIEIEEGNKVYYKEENMIKKKETEELVHYIGCYQMEEISIPTSVSSIGKNCFTRCFSLQEINIPTSVRSIGDYCFSECSKLFCVNISTSVNSIGNGCFYGCGFYSISIPSNVISFGSNCFECCCNLQSIEIDENNPLYYSEEKIEYFPTHWGDGAEYSLFIKRKSDKKTVLYHHSIDCP